MAAAIDVASSSADAPKTRLLTIFSTCKPFEGKFAAIQTNALRSWRELCPPCEVVIFGDEPGVRDHCNTLGLRQVPELVRSERGTPLVDGLFASAERIAGGDLLAFVNADIILTRGLLDAVERVLARFPRFLLIARRWNVDLDDEWDFSAKDWESRLFERVRDCGQLEPAYGGIDVFVYPRGLWGSLPPFAIGRGRWDSALVYAARKLKVPVIDATEVVTCVHQNHDYSYHPQSTSASFKGPEALRNEELLGGPEFIFTALNATHTLSASGIRRQLDLYPPHLLRRMATLPALYAPLRPLAPVVGWLAPWWRVLRKARDDARGSLTRVAAVRRARAASAATPYPISIGPKPIDSNFPPGGGVATFESPEARAINRARMEHLSSLGLPLSGRRVLDVGCGVGHLAQFFVERGCEVLCVDGRKENIDHLRSLYPSLEARVLDIEAARLPDLGSFEIVFAYGLLYHLENPLRALRDLASVSSDLLLLETMVTDHHLPLIRFEEETSSYSQTLRNIGSRPTPSFVVLALRAAGFRYVYAPRTMPAHPDFRTRWKGDLSDFRGDHALRSVFIASRQPLLNPALVNLIPRE